MRRKFTAALGILLASALLYARPLRVAHRYFEWGINADINVANNYLTPADLLQRHVAIDLKRIADTMKTPSFRIDTNNSVEYFMNLNLPNGVHAGLSAGVDISGNMNIAKAVFDFLGNGNKLGEKVDIKNDMRLDAFAYVDTSAGFNFRKSHITVVPAVFHPLLHAETTTFSASLENNASGKTAIAADAEVKVCSFMDIGSYIGQGGEPSNPAEGLKTGWGFDLNVAVEHKVLDTLQCGAYMRVPFVPGRLENEILLEAKMQYDVASLSDVAGGAVNSYSFMQTANRKESFLLHRPFRMGAEVAWRPVGKWLTVGSLLGLGVSYPYRTYARPYIDYNIYTNLSLFEILGLTLSSARFNQVFRQHVGIMLNARVLQIDIGVSSQSSGFAHSFQLSGVGAFVGIALGF